jgi:hypothetical protein
MLKAIWGYFSYVCRHKWYVFVEGWKLGVGLWQLLVHDFSKFGLREFIPYMNKFNRHLKSDAHQRAFDIAWLHHIHVNPHHWQHWILHNDQDGITVLRMPEKYVKEMIADWRGVGRALGKGADNAIKWYIENKDTLALHPQTRSRVETILGVTKPNRYVQTVAPPRHREPGS